MEILFETDDFIIVDKPAGLSVHNEEASLIDQLEQKYHRKHYLVNRLDALTSGITLVATSSKAAASLQKALESSTKIYHGIIRGNLKQEHGTWTKPLSDKSCGRKNPQGPVSERKNCTTHFKTIKKNKYFTLLEFQIETGRQHQIRKHTAIAGHHLVGDPRYGDKKYNQMILSKYETDRMFLHAHKLLFSYKDKNLEFTSKTPLIFDKIV